MKRKEIEHRILGPALSRRPFSTRLFEPREFAEVANSWAVRAELFLNALPERPPDLDCSTEDVSFREGFHSWLRERDGVEEDSLRPKRHHRKERILRAPMNTCDPEADAMTTTLGVTDVVEDAGNVTQPVITPKTKRKLKEEAEEETVELVRSCIEGLTAHTNAALEMITQRNTNLTGAPFRQKLFRMYGRIAKYLEECEGRRFDEKPHHLKKHRMKRLDPTETRLVQARIEALEKRRMALETSRFFEDAPNPTADAGVEGQEEQMMGDLDGFPPVHGVDASSPMKMAIDWNITNASVIEIEFVHPCYLRSQATVVRALGTHRLEDVVELCTCTSDDAALAMEMTNNARYVFIEGVFYIDPEDDIVLEDIAGISCGWPLDVEASYNHGFRIASLQTQMKDIPLRASNKPMYLYVHQGGCEHLIHVRDVWLPHKEDAVALCFGPIRTHIAQPVFHKCSMCEKTFAAWVVYGSGMNITDPSFYCDTCYQLAHYDCEGTEVDIARGHVVYPYKGG